MKHAKTAKFFSVYLVVAMVASLSVLFSFPAVAAASEWDGSTIDTSWHTADAEATFYIQDAADLAGLASLVNAGTDTFEGDTIVLTSDIDLNGKEWTRIGSDTSHMFQGSFDGKGHTINHLSFSDGQYNAFFGYTGGTTSIKNLIINRDDSSNNKSNATLVGKSNGSLTVENVTLSRVTEKGAVYSAGAIAENAATLYMKNVVVKGNILGQDVGSFVSLDSGTSTFENCRNEAKVESTNGFAAGFIGRKSNANKTTFINCVNHGYVFSSNADNVVSVGGFVACYSSDQKNAVLEFQNCINYGDVAVSDSNTTAVRVGGFLGTVGSTNGGNTTTRATTNSLINCANYGTISAPSAGFAGGIFGSGTNIGTAQATNIMLLNVVSDGEIEATTGGQIIGCASSDVNIQSDSDNIFYGSAGVSDPCGTGTLTNVLAIAENTDVQAGTITAADAVTELNTEVNNYNSTATVCFIRQWKKSIGTKITPANPISSASLTLSDNLSINLFMDETDIKAAYDATAVEIYQNDNAEALSGVSGKYIATGIKASEMAKKHAFTVKLTIGEKTLPVFTFNYSIADYASNMYGNATLANADLDNLLVAMMVYGDAAETAKKGSSDILENFDTKTDYDKTLDSTLSEKYAALSLSADTLPTLDTTYISEIGLKLTETICPVITLKENATSVKVSIYGKEKTYTAVEGVVIVENSLTVTSLKNEMTLTFLDTDGNPLACATEYTIANFIISAQSAYASEQNYLNLSQALAVYMQASRIYAGLTV